MGWSCLFGRGPTTPGLGDFPTITMGNFTTGMILQVPSTGSPRRRYGLRLWQWQWKVYPWGMMWCLAGSLWVWQNYPSLKPTVCPWKSMVGRWHFLLGCPIFRAMLVSGSVWLQTLLLQWVCKRHSSFLRRRLMKYFEQATIARTIYIYIYIFTL